MSLQLFRLVRRVLAGSALMAGLAFPLAACSTALAQPASGKGKLALAGVAAAEIERRYGKPDEVRKDTAGRDVWHYGASSIFLADEKVTAWVDQGELAKRESAIAMKPSTSAKRSDDLREEWVNPWTPRR